MANVIDYYAAYNVGKPLLEEEIEAQLHGGVLQGIAQVLWEGAIYGDDGTPLHTTLADYGLPSPSDVTYKVLTKGLNTPSILPGGLRGIGEAGTTGALASAFLALEKAIRAKTGIRIKLNRTPVTPSYLHNLINNQF
ncbi:molybdopterin cofactor-binding domain-containing protein [Vulcanisaeta sp. JCM 16159]|uniref:molybdopterin cofactor-binding domain-containing protein n=1 Tax=Vulcanisaeta sp. JCM 16159 TaxID=1295371 RepID=UPI000A5273A1|nr:molybdopterin cofactor-binding domain-containing protein [Vulcanisaeta sp. JCM 16159]